MAEFFSGKPALFSIFDLFAPLLRKSRFGRSLLENFHKHRSVYSILEKAFIIFALVMLVQTLVIRPFHIPSDSMAPSLQVGDNIFIFRLPYLYNATPDRGDIVVFKPPESAHEESKDVYYVKRVVGLPGETISIKNHRLIIDGKEVLEPEIFRKLHYESPRWLPNNHGQFQVPDASVLVFGDNSRDSIDSRVWGPVPIENIEGEVFYRFWPLDRLGRPE